MFENIPIWALVLLGLGAAAALYAIYHVLTGKDGLLAIKLKQDMNDEYIKDPVKYYTTRQRWR